MCRIDHDLKTHFETLKPRLRLCRWRVVKTMATAHHGRRTALTIAPSQPGAGSKSDPPIFPTVRPVRFLRGQNSRFYIERFQGLGHARTVARSVTGSVIDARRDRPDTDQNPALCIFRGTGGTPPVTCAASGDPAGWVASINARRVSVSSLCPHALGVCTWCGCPSTIGGWPLGRWLVSREGSKTRPSVFSGGTGGTGGTARRGGGFSGSPW